MELVLENERMKLELMPEGGEMKSLFDKKNQQEIMYQRDEGWSGSNPSLFPIIGSTWTKEYTIDGKTYSMKNHGLIRYATLEAKVKPDSISFVYDSDEETKKQYPFDFHYEINFALLENGVKISYDITNTGDRTMPFSFGLHPAFRVPQKEGESFEDYSLVYTKPSKATQLVFTPDFDPVKKEEVVLDEWKLNRDDIDKYATMVFTDYDNDQVSLAVNGEKRITVTYPEFPFLAIWSHPSRSHFICIEPWFGHADFEKVADDFYHREGTQLLEPGQTFSCFYTIELGE
jgi:galactose mutarotase-like enzyme